MGWKWKIKLANCRRLRPEPVAVIGRSAADKDAAGFSRGCDAGERGQCRLMMGRPCTSVYTR